MAGPETTMYVLLYFVRIVLTETYWFTKNPFIIQANNTKRVWRQNQRIILQYYKSYVNIFE